MEVKVEKCESGAGISDIRRQEQRFRRGRQDAEAEILPVAKGATVRMTELVGRGPEGVSRVPSGEMG